MKAALRSFSASFAFEGQREAQPDNCFSRTKKRQEPLSILWSPFNQFGKKVHHERCNLSGSVIKQNSQNFCQGLDKSPVPDNKNVGFHFTYVFVDENDTRCNHGSAADTKLGPALKTKNNRAPSSACGCMRPRGNLTQPTTTNEGYVKPKKQLRLLTGAKIVLIGGGVGSGKLLVWDHIE